MRKNGSVLIGVLWCIALLSIVVISTLHSSSLALRIGHHQTDSIQAHYLALAGAERAKALLFHDAARRRQSHVNYDGQLSDAPSLFQDTPFANGTFSIIRPNPRPASPLLVYGVKDEESRLNLNTATSEQLARLPQMPPTAPPAILDWRDPDDQVTPNGAEIDAYASLASPYKPRNGPFLTVAELLMVQQIPAQLIHGEDTNLNGLLDPEEDDGNLTTPTDDANGSLNAGWSALLTVTSSTQNNSASGEARLNLNTAEASELQQIPGISDTIAQSIITSRANRQLENLLDLLEIRAPATPPVNANAEQLQNPQPTPTSPNQDNAPTGPPLIDDALLKNIADLVTVTDQTTQPGLVNVNTANAEVLACLPGLDPQSAQSIINHRSSAGYFPNIAALLDVPSISRETLRQLAPTITTRSETFRILSEGVVTSSGARKRIELVVHVDASGIDTLAYRDNL